MVKNKGSFNKGWWNCFESFAAELLDCNPQADNIAYRVLQGAGITQREASYWLDHTDCPYPRVTQVVRRYWLDLPIKQK